MKPFKLSHTNQKILTVAITLSGLLALAPGCGKVKKANAPKNPLTLDQSLQVRTLNIKGNQVSNSVTMFYWKADETGKVEEGQVVKVAKISGQISKLSSDQTQITADKEKLKKDHPELVAMATNIENSALDVTVKLKDTRKNEASLKDANNLITKALNSDLTLGAQVADVDALIAKQTDVLYKNWTKLKLEAAKLDRTRANTQAQKDPLDEKKMLGDKERKALKKEIGAINASIDEEKAKPTPDQAKIDDLTQQLATKTKRKTDLEAELADLGAKIDDIQKILDQNDKDIAAKTDEITAAETLISNAAAEVRAYPPAKDKESLANLIDAKLSKRAAEAALDVSKTAAKDAETETVDSYVMTQAADPIKKFAKEYLDLDLKAKHIGHDSIELVTALKETVDYFDSAPQFKFKPTKDERVPNVELTKWGVIPGGPGDQELKSFSVEAKTIQNVDYNSHGGQLSFDVIDLTAKEQYHMSLSRSRYADEAKEKAIFYAGTIEKRALNSSLKDKPLHYGEIRITASEFLLDGAESKDPAAKPQPNGKDGTSQAADPAASDKKDDK